jgi:hypothetical protein
MHVAFIGIRKAIVAKKVQANCKKNVITSQSEDKKGDIMQAEDQKEA